MPESLKFFLFGVSKRRRRSRKDSSEIIEEFPVIESGNYSLAESIEKWASIESNILRDFSMQSIAIGLGLDVSEIKDYFNNVSTEGFYKWRNRARIILASTKTNAWILDPFSGSGTTGIAANLLGRKYLGLEIEDSSLAMSKARRIEIENKSIRQSYIDKLAKMHLTSPQDTLFSDDFEEYGVPWL